MNLSNISHIRLINQQIAGTNLKTAKQVTAWIGAIQAQDYDMCKWAIGIRLPGSTYQTIEAALDKGDIIRTHLLRPTWHLVSADDIYWMLGLTAPQIKAAMKSNDKRLELDEAVFTKSNKLIVKALDGKKHLTREELLSGFKNEGILINDNRASHLLLRAEIEGLICSGIKKDKNQTYTLLEEWVPQRKVLNKEEALAKLAAIYFTSRAPATLSDFVWWSGLPVTSATLALEMIKADFIPETIGSGTYWLPKFFIMPGMPKKTAVYLLPAFDEFLIGYADRTAALALEHQPHTLTKNGIFKPVVVVNGQVTGVWKRTIKKDRVIIETDFLKQPNRATQKLIKKASAIFGSFMGKTVV